MTPGPLQWIGHTALAAAMRGEHGWEWLYPIDETLHVATLGLVFGSILILDLRLIGGSARGSRVSQLAAEVLPLTWSAFAGAVITGSLMFIARPEVYFYNRQFELKMLCMLLAAINMVIFHFGIYRRLIDWDSSAPPRAARIAGVVSITLWLGVIVFGRWTGFTS